MQSDKNLLVSILRGSDAPAPLTLDAVRAWQDGQVDLLAFDRLTGRGLGNLWPAGDPGIADRLREASAFDALDAQAVRAVLEALYGAGIRGVLLKGWALAHTHYRRPWLRPRSDLDLLVPMLDLDPTGAVVTSLGFTAEPETTDPLVTTQRHFRRAEPTPLALDIHGTLVNPLVLRTLPSCEVLQTRAVPVPALGPAAFALAAPDALLHALVHRVAHHNSTTDVLWLHDVHLLAGGLDAGGWATLVNEARRAEVCAIALDGLQVAVQDFGTRVPASVLSTLRDAPAEPSAALVGGHLTEWRLQWINFQSLDGVADRLRFVRAHLFPPVHLVKDARTGWRRPLAYGRRVMRGMRKWLTPIGRDR